MNLSHRESPTPSAAPAPITVDPALAGTATVPGTPRLSSAGRRRRPSGEPPPLPRQLHRSGKYWLAATLAVLAFALAHVATRSKIGLTLTTGDLAVLRWLADARTPTLLSAARSVSAIATSVPIQVAWLVLLAVLVGTRRWRHLFVSIVAVALVNMATASVAALVRRPRPLGIEILGSWRGYAMPSLPIAILTAVAVCYLYALLPQGRWRQLGKALAAGLVAVVALSRLHLAQDTPSDVLVAVLIGVTIPLVAFRLLVPNEVFPVSYSRRRTAHLEITGARYEAIRRALTDQLGVRPIEVQPFGLAGSGGSTPLRVKVEGPGVRYLFCKLYANNHVRSDRWYKLGRTLLYGGLEDEKAFNSVRRLVQYEDYALRVLFAAGLPVPAPGGIVEITPEREYLLVMEFFDGAQEIGEVRVDEAVIDQGLAIIRRLWEAGLAHRDIKPANLLIRDGRLLLIDSAFAQIRPTPWRQAVDLANMMLVLALSSDVPQVYARARLLFTEDEIAEAIAATRGLTMPTQLRRLMREQGRDLHDEFKRLLPGEVRPIAIQRFSWRRVVLTLGVLLAAIIGGVAGAQILTSPLS